MDEIKVLKNQIAAIKLDYINLFNAVGASQMKIAESMEKMAAALEKINDNLLDISESIELYGNANVETYFIEDEEEMEEFLNSLDKDEREEVLKQLDIDKFDGNDENC